MVKPCSVATHIDHHNRALNHSQMGNLVEIARDLEKNLFLPDNDSFAPDYSRARVALKFNSRSQAVAAEKASFENISSSGHFLPETFWESRVIFGHGSASA